MAAPSLDEFLTAARADNPGVSDGALAAYWLRRYGPGGAAGAGVPKPEATAGGLIRSFGASAIDTVGSAMQGGGEVAAAGINAAFDTQLRAVNPLKAITDPIRAGMSVGDKLAEQDTFRGDILDPASIELPKTGAGWAHAIASGFGSLSSMILPGVMAATGRRGMIAAGSLVGGLTTGGAAAEEVRQNIGRAMENKTADELAATIPAYREARAAGLDDGAARDKVQNDSAILATVLAGAAGAAGGAFNAKVLEDVVAKRGLATLLGRAAKTRAGQIGIGAGVGVAAEGLQEGLEKVGQNIGENIGTGRPAFEDATRDTVGDVIIGGMIGGVTGGAAGAVTHRQPEKPAVDPKAETRKAIDDIARAPNADAAIDAFNRATAPRPTPAEPPIEFDRLGALGLLNAPVTPAAPADTGESIPYDYSQRSQMYPALPAPDMPTGRPVLINDTDPELTRVEQYGDREAAVNAAQAGREAADRDLELGITPGTRQAIRARVTLDEDGNIIEAPEEHRRFLALTRRDARPHAAAAIEAHAVNPGLVEAILAAPSAGARDEQTVFEAIINGTVNSPGVAAILGRHGIPSGLSGGGRDADINGAGAQPGAAAPPGQQPPPGGAGGGAATSADAGRDDRGARVVAGVSPGVSPEGGIVTPPGQIPVENLHNTTPERAPGPFTLRGRWPQEFKTGELALLAKNTRSMVERAVARAELDRRNPTRQLDKVSTEARRALWRAVVRAGGIHQDEAADMGIDRRSLPGYRMSGFVTAGGMRADILARFLAENDYLTPEQMADVDGGAEAARQVVVDLLAREFVGRSDERDLFNEALSRHHDAGTIEAAGVDALPEVDRDDVADYDDSVIPAAAAEFDAALDAEPNMTVGDAMRALGFTEAEISDAERSVPEKRGPVAPEAGSDEPGGPEGGGGAGAVAAQRGESQARRESGDREGATAVVEAPTTEVDAAAHEAATSPQNSLPEPTEEQKKAGNYAKGHVSIAGLDVSIENPAGSKRRPEWPTLQSHYGYFKRTEGNDGDHVDTFIRPGTPTDYDGPVFVVDQVDPKTGRFDEHKVMVGWPDEAAARAAYLENYTPDWKGLRAITRMNMEEFKAWLRDGDTTKAAAAASPEPFALSGAAAQRQPTAAGRRRAARAVALFKKAAEDPLRAAELLGGREFAQQFEMGDGDIVSAEVVRALQQDAAFVEALGSPVVQRYVPTWLRAALDAIGKNPEQPATPPAAESQAPGRSADGDRGVAPTREGGGPEVTGGNASSRWESFVVEPAPRDGRFLVGEARADGSRQWFLEFGVDAKGKPARVQHFYESAQTRGPAELAMNRWAEQRAASSLPSPDDSGIPQPQWWTDRTGAERAFALKAAGIKGTASTPWNRLSTKDQRALDRQWGQRQEPPAPEAAPEVTLPANAAKSPEQLRAEADLMAGLADLADIFGKNVKAGIAPEQQQKLLPVLTRVFDAAFRLGMVKFKQAAKFVLDTIRQRIGPEVADQITLDDLQGAYIGMAQNYRDKGADTKRAVIEVETLAELETEPEKAQNAQQEPSNGQPATATRDVDRPGEGALEGAPSEDVRAPGGGRNAGQGTDGGGRDDGGRGAGSGEPGVQPPRGVGTGAGEVPVPAGRTRSRGRARGAKSDSRRGAGLPQDDGLFGALDANPAPNAAPIPAPAFDPVAAAPAAEPQDFTITEDLALGEGGQKQKFRNNVAAIRLLQDLEASGRQATAEDQRVLALYVGWGGLPQAFDENNAKWTDEHAELKSLLGEEDYAAAARSTRYAHYTSREIIQDGIYNALRHFGFTGGKLLESSGGVGNFLGLMPTDMRSASRFTMIEREPIAAGIAKHLYPRQNVIREDFTFFKGADGYFDAAPGNPPFASDPQTDRSGRKHLNGMSLHNYFFAKTVDMLREGGILAQVVTSSFLDSRRDTARTYIAERTELLGAIRLPNNAFKANAGTEVTTDLIFLKKRPESDWGSMKAKVDMQRWIDVVPFKDSNGGQDVPLNRYFAENPDMMLGNFGRFGTMYGPDEPALVARPGQDTSALLREAVKRLPDDVYVPAAVAGTAAIDSRAIVALKDATVQEGGYYVDGDRLYQRLPDLAGERRAVEITPATPWTEKQALGDLRFDRIKQLAGIRRTLRKLIALEKAGDGAMTIQRKTLNRQYDAYVKAHGFINDRATAQVFDDDPDYPLLAALETEYTPPIGAAAAKQMGIKPVPSSAKKMPIFERPVVDNRKPVEKVDSPADAIAVSIAERGVIDSAFVAKLLGRDADGILEQLAKGDNPVLFLDPATNEYVLRDEYLSGNVRSKLAQAKEAGLFDNVAALERVLPPDVGAHEISARVGSPWVPETVYEDFAKELFGPETVVGVRYVKANSSYLTHIEPGTELANTNKWGTPRYAGVDLLAALLNNRDIKVTVTDRDGKTHVLKEETEAANVKAQEIRDKFNDWLFADPVRSELLVRAYNDTNNNYVTRQFDGSWARFPGKVPDSIIKFRRHQRNAIARIIQDRTALLDHVVGAGKTFTMVSAAMELKRTGLAKKPMIAVPNHLVKQWAADFYRLYPGANILTATKKDFERVNRRRFLAKIATGDWDAVIIAHSSFGFIKPDAVFEAEFSRRMVKKIEETIKAVDDANMEDRAKRRTVKQLEALKERIENRIKSLRDKPVDQLLDFGEIGIDQLFVDEAHLFKNLMFTTKMQNIRGLGDSKGSQRAYDMFLKVNQIYARNGRQQGVVFATGTPVSNSLAEMYHMMRYLMPDTMEELGFESFDAWANTFAAVSQQWDQKPSGDGFKAINTMSDFVNTHELLRIFDQVCDTVTMDDIKAAFREENDGNEFPLPKLKTGRRQPVSLKKSEAQNAYMVAIAGRAQALEVRRGPPKKGEDNHLVVMTDARKAAMDIRLVDLSRVEREPGGRIDAAAERIFDRYRQWSAHKGTQLVFSDLGTPIKTVKKELAEYQELMAAAAVLQDEAVTSLAALGDDDALRRLEDAQKAQDALDAKGPDWKDAIQAALRGFSVYDDLRAALIERGIPAAEIAFIHDYNTDEQKAGLFRKMNAGDIRVLIGSTAKLGAGTNVQQRLVALHHLDVPWKPSDVEQREGRIIRQGNKLEQLVKDFEVEILAYVTQDTLDMKMWMIQERKLKMINQLRSRQIERVIENSFEDMEMSAGEMQAAATGNMDLLREIQLRSDVKKLEQKKRAFEAQRNDLISRTSRAEAEVERLPKEIAVAAPAAGAAQQYRDALKADAFKPMTINGTQYETRDAASRALRAVIEDFKIKKEEFKKQGVETDLKFSVEINGQTYTAMTKASDAFVEIAGDADPIEWALDGTTYKRRAKIREAIRPMVLETLDQYESRAVGSVGDFAVTIEGQSDRNGNDLVDVRVRHKDSGFEQNDVSGVPMNGEGESAKPDISYVAERVTHLVTRMLDRLPGQVDYDRRQLADAQRSLRELRAAPAMAEWPGEGELRKAREAHREVLRRLAGNDKKEGGDAEAGGDSPVFSRGRPPAYMRQDDYRFTQTTDSRSMPAFASTDLVLAHAREVDALGVPAGAKAMAFNIFDRRVKDARGKATFVGKVLVHMDAAGRFVSLRNIVIAEKHRQQGRYLGEGAILGMLRHNDGAPMEVYNIESAARGDENDALPFWRTIGTTILNVSSDPDVAIIGRIALPDYLKAAAKRRRMRGYGSDTAATSRGQPPAARGDAARDGQADAGGSGGGRGVRGRERRPADTGAVARRDATTSPARAGLSVSAIQSEVARLTAGWANAPAVTVLATPADAPFEAPGDANGALWRGRIYLFASNLRQAAEAEFVLFHEALGHLGLRGAFGADLDAALRHVWLANKNVRAAAAKWTAAYARDAIAQRVQAGMSATDARRAVEVLAIEEALADLAGRGERLTGLQRLAAVLQDVLRRLGFTRVADWLEGATDAEVGRMLEAARQYVETGDRAQAARIGELAGIYSRRALEGMPLFSRRQRPNAGVRDETSRLDDDLFDMTDADEDALLLDMDERDLAAYEKAKPKGMSWLDYERQSEQTGHHEYRDGSVTRGKVSATYGENSPWRETAAGRDVDALRALRREAIQLEKKSPAYFYIEEDGSATITVVDARDAPKGMLALARRHNLKVDVVVQPAMVRTRADSFMPDEYRESGAKYAQEMTQIGDHTRRARADVPAFSRGTLFDESTAEPAPPQETRSRVDSLADTVRGAALGAFTRRQLAEMYGRDAPEVAEYDRMAAAMDADRANLSQEADRVLQAWRALGRDTADKMADIMHEATLAQFDPDTGRRGDGYGLPAALANALADRFAALPESAKAVYRQARDMYGRRLEALFEALAARIQRSGADPDAARRTVDQLRQQYDRHLSNGPYFPLARFGDYLLIANRREATGADDDRVVMTFESAAERDRQATLMKAKGYRVKTTVAKEYSRTRDGSAGPLAEAMTEAIEALEMDHLDLQGADGKSLGDLKGQLLDELNQALIRGLPELSYRKHFVHRKGTPGFSRDAMRAFADSQLHAANHIARMEYGDRLARELDRLQERVTETGDGDVTVLQQVANEMVKRHELALNHVTHPVAAMLGQLGFFMSLGASVASGVVNLTQTPLVTYPWLAARHGWGKTSLALSKAARDYAASPWEWESGMNAAKNAKLAADETAMLRGLEDRGLINTTLAHDLAGASSTDNLNQFSKYGSAWQRVMRFAGWSFHVPEVANRQITALAAYRLARAGGKTAEAATEAAAQAITATHFDYSSGNRARYFEGNFRRVILMFKQYSQNIAYLYGRAAYQAFRGATAAEKREARRLLAGMLGVQFAAAGALGLPFVGSVAAVIAAAMNGFADDDEEFDWQVEFRKWMASTVGKDMGEALSHGLPRLVLGWDVAGRIGQSDLFVRGPNREQEGRDAYLAWMQALAGPVAGYALNGYLGVSDLAKGAGSLNGGLMMRGVEEMMPAAVRNALKAMRYEAEDGLRTRGGQKQIELDAFEKVGQAMGFTPTRVSEFYEGSSAIRNREHRIDTRRRDLLDRYAEAVRERDAAGLERVRADIVEFNGRNPAVAIRGDTLLRSMQNRRRREGAPDGIYLPRNREFLRQEGAFANL